MNEVKGKLDIIIDKDDCDFADFIHISTDYDLTVLDCLLYFAIGKIYKNLSRYLECEVCRSELCHSKEGAWEVRNHPTAKIINLNEDFKLRHQNKKL